MDSGVRSAQRERLAERNPQMAGGKGTEGKTDVETDAFMWK
jgi:hypothetical protein